MIRVLFLLALTGLMACQGGSDTSPSVDEDISDYRIAFNTLHDVESSNYEVFVMNTDGTELVNITNHPALDWATHASGNNVFFVSDRDTCARCYYLYSCNSDGNDLRRITDFRLQDSWVSSRKSGTELIVKPHRTVDSAFRVIDLSGNVLARLDPGLPYFNDPAFSPDGSLVAFRGANTPSKRDSGHLDEIYTIKPDGTGLKKLTEYPAADTTAAWFEYRAGPPVWSPDGNSITYPSYQGGALRLFQVKSDGTGQARVFTDKQSQGWHDWSPDGQWVIYDINSAPKTANYANFDIYLRHRDGQSAIRLTQGIQYEQAPFFIAPVPQ